MDTEDGFVGLTQLATDFSHDLLAYLPQLAVALALLLVGWIMGRIARWLTVRLLARLGRIRSGKAVDRAVRESGIERVASEVVPRVVFWTVFVFFAALAGEVLGLAVASNGLSLLMRYLPSVLAAVVILLAGLVLSNLARDAVVTVLTSAGIAGALPGQFVRVAVLLLMTVVALDQIGIDSTLLILAVGIVLAAILGSVALAVGLGARTEVSNIIAVHYLSRAYSVGQRVRIGDADGRIVEIGLTGVALETAQGRLRVPAKDFSERVSCLVGQEV
jgi:small-conductance mechanosensitive channel